MNLRKMKITNGTINIINTKTSITISYYLFEPLASIFNNYINKSIKPNPGKIVEIVPIHKYGTKQDRNNYRPISLISNNRNVFKEIIHNRILD